MLSRSARTVMLHCRLQDVRVSTCFACRLQTARIHDLQCNRMLEPAPAVMLHCRLQDVSAHLRLPYICLPQYVAVHGWQQQVFEICIAAICYGSASSHQYVVKCFRMLVQYTPAVAMSSASSLLENRASSSTAVWQC